MISFFKRLLTMMYPKSNTPTGRTNTTKENLTTMSTRTVLFLRPRRASATKRRTQIQIPIALANTAFFAGVYGVSSPNGTYHKFVFAHAHGRINTIKLEVPEIKTMTSPILKLTRNDNGSVSYEAIDGQSERGASITRQLLWGAGVSVSVTRRANPTLWLQQVA